MSSEFFTVKDHIVPCQHIREGFMTTSPDNPGWRMQVKQYTPRDNPSSKEGDITILSSHANGFPVELYEPFWDDLLSTLTPRNLKIRNIFIITHPHLSSYSLNPGLTEDGSQIPDSSRDLLLLVNHFRDTILHPIIGIGHSVGASQLLTLSLMHPSLFTSLVLIEPIISDNGSEAGVEKLALAAIRRRREWKSRAEAEAYFGKAWGGWDPRVRQKWNSSALIPSDVNNVDGKTELAWARVQELHSYMNPSELRDLAAGENAEGGKGRPAWTPYPLQIWERIRDLGVHALFVCGAGSAQNSERIRKHWKGFTGTNEKFWSRGFQRRIELKIIGEGGHLVPLEAPTKCADSAGVWIEEEMKVWWKEWAKDRRWRQTSEKDKGESIEKWMAGLKSRI
ncbi:prolyl aminopeptidase-like protein [Hyaloscypha variabilis]